MSENRSPMFIRPETVAGQENMIPCVVAKEKNSYTGKQTRRYCMLNTIFSYHFHNKPCASLVFLISPKAFSSLDNEYI